MELKTLKPRKAINKAFLKIKPNRTEIERFKANLIQLLDKKNDTESEEFHKNLVSDFLKKTYYDPNHFINTKERKDLVIHNGDKANSSVGVIIEAKRPTNKAEMLTKQKINVKAFQELVLYYLRERFTHKNLEIKYLVATNINEWFIFDSNVFEKQFAQNKELVEQFNDFENGRLASKTTDFFYKEIAAPFINDLNQAIEFTFFDIREYEKQLCNDNPKDDNKLISLYKLLSPEHLLKLPFANDSNSLDKIFYGELLHIIGLSETKNGSKKIIERNKKNQRNTGSLLENAIIQLESLDKINRLDNPSHFGTTQEERLFNVGIELSITWINRILFLKLLEAQLKTYHKADKSYEFLSIDKIHNYDDLNSLFFQVLAKKQSERNKDVKEAFAKIPYLNSSLFEPTGIEHGTLFISNLGDEKTIPIYSSTVLKNGNGKKRTGNLNALEYLFEFLNAYDFSSEGKEEIQEDNKTLINAAVLGLIFEKINGYKEGSFFTPGFITMYMCRETIRKAIVQKFNETKDWNCKDIDSLYNKIEDIQEANDIINSLKIGDPAVGSGHFLVSALNEMIAIKNNLNILQDRKGRRLKEYQFEVVNDELIVTDEDGELFEYNPTNKESQRIQEALFHEKQTIIENCLFGVDINPNSVKICQLRLWIELLKNAYYKNESELETLPNIDINIKCGNSLISRFELAADLKKALKKSKWTIDTYRGAVDTYRNAKNKEQKRAMEKLIDDIKKDFRSEISLNDPKVKKLNKLKGDIFGMTKQTQLFEMTKREKTVWNKKLKKLTEDAKKVETTIEDIKNNKIYEEAFEWRFEFPEVLDDNGDFVGFDVVIGNPPYVQVSEYQDYYVKNYYTSKCGDLYAIFYEKGFDILKSNGSFSFITPSLFIKGIRYEALRKYLLEHTKILEVDDKGDGVFADVQMPTAIFVAIKKIVENQNWSKYIPGESITSKILLNSKPLEEFISIKRGLEIGKNKIYPFDNKNVKILTGSDVERYSIKSFQSINSNTYNEFKKDNKFFKTKRIVIRETGNRITSLIVDENVQQNRSLYSILINENKFDYEYFLGIINSKLIQFFYKSKFTANTDVFPKIRMAQVKKLPIKLSSKDTQLLLVRRVKNMISSLNDFSILTKSYLNLLKSKFRISKPSKKLQNWHELDFGEFLKELEKARKKGITTTRGHGALINAQKKQYQKLSLSEEAEWMEYFNSQKQKVEELKATIDKTDSQIDQMVYELYGLNEKEIKIIEEASV